MQVEQATSRNIVYVATNIPTEGKTRRVGVPAGRRRDPQPGRLLPDRGDGLWESPTMWSVRRIPIRTSCSALTADCCTR